MTTAEARAVLDQHQGNVTAAATAIGITRHAWARRYGRMEAVEGPTKTQERTVVLADIHAPYHDQDALEIALEYAADLSPDRVVLLGDFFDCYAVSYWRKDPTRLRFPDEIDAAKAVLTQISQALPKAKKVYIEGNHESRVRDYLWGKASELFGLSALTVPELFGLEELGWRWVSNSKLLEEEKPPFAIGKLYLLHGHEVRVSGAAVNLPRLYYQKCHMNVLIGHHHQPQEFIARRIDSSHSGAWSAGCLCKLGAEYAPVNNWCHGLAVVDHDPSTGSFSVQNKKIIEGRVL